MMVDLDTCKRILLPHLKRGKKVILVILSEGLYKAPVSTQERVRGEVGDWSEGMLGVLFVGRDGVFKEWQVRVILGEMVKHGAHHCGGGR